MGLRRPSRRDDVDVDSFLANLHRVDGPSAPMRRILDLRPDEVVDVDVDVDEREPTPSAPARR